MCWDNVYNTMELARGENILRRNQLAKVGRDEYPVTTTSALDLLIFTEGGIQGNQKSSTNKNCRVRGGRQHKERMGHTFTQKK